MWQRWMRGSISVAGALLPTGCAGFLTGGVDAACAQGMLSVKAGEGETCLESLQQQSAFARWMAENGAPDYVEPSGAEVRFFYIERDAVVRFDTGWLAADEPTIESRIRSADHVQFSHADRARLGQVRLQDASVPPSDEPAPGGGVRRARVGEDD